MATINGTSGNDTLNGTSGDDTIAGGAGADVIDGGAGSDTIYSGDVSPAYSFPYYGNPYTPPVLDHGTEVDTITGGDGSDTIFAGYGDNVDGGANDYVGDKLFISFQGATSGVTFDGHLSTQVIGGGTITGIENISWVEGSNYDDYIDAGSDTNTGYSDRAVVEGMAGNDTLIAGYYTALLDGGDGNDILDGRNGQYLQEVDGGAGDDTLYTNPNVTTVANGGDGNDTIYANAEIHGGAGDDIIHLVDSAYSGLVTGDDGNDTIFGDDRANQIDGGAGSDTLDGGGGHDTLTGGAGVDTFKFESGGGSDTITDLTAGESVHITGYSSAQSATQSGSDVILILSGTDVITFNNTTVATVRAALNIPVNSGTPTIGTSGDDTMNGTSGDDTIYGLAGHDTIHGLAGNDLIHGGEDSDYLYGDGGDDTLYGEGGYDNIDGGTGNDTIYAGADGGTFSGGDGNDTIVGTSGANDLVNYLSATGGVKVSLAISAAQNTVSAGYDTLVDIDSLQGSAFNDVLTGNDTGNQLIGGAGDDRLFGGGSYDLLYGQDGNDWLDGGTGIDQMYGGTGDDTYVVDDPSDKVFENPGEGTDTILSSVSYSLLNQTSPWIPSNVERLTLTGTANIDATGDGLANILTGNSGDNALYGYSGEDKLIGGDGNDILNGGGDVDRMIGGAGDDEYHVDLYGDVVVENPGEGTDIVYSIASYVLPDNVENLTLLPTADTIWGYGNGIDNVLTGNDGNNKLFGLGGNDTLDGGAGSDRLFGGTGDDTYYVDSYSDRIVENAGEGNDRVFASTSVVLDDNVEQLTLTGTSNIWGYGNASDNLLTGNSGANKLFGMDGNDTLDGGAGADKMFGGTGNDTYYVDNYNDRVIENAGEGTDSVFSSTNYKLADNIEQLTLTGSSSIWGYGNAIANTLTGNDAANKLYGLGGSDTIDGHGGSDWIEGGAGQDFLTGGSGADAFVFRDGDFAALTQTGCDEIRDFSESDGDTIRLNYVDADTGTTGDQAFSFIGSNAFHDVAGELRYEQVNGDTYLMGDTNGDGIADFMIKLDGLHALNAGEIGL
jgi:Ca2+-binding RTX toxin-like protein